MSNEDAEDSITSLDGGLDDEQMLHYIRSNSPKVKFLDVDLCNYSNGYPTTVNWEEEQWCFFENTHLEEITLDIAPEETVRALETVRAFATALSRSRSIRYMHLEISDIDRSRNPVLGGQLMRDIFSRISPLLGLLQKFELVNTDLNDDGVQAFKTALGAYGGCSWQEIIFGCNWTSDEQAGIILDTISRHCNNLASFTWGWDNEDGFMGSRGFRAFANFIDNPLSSLEELDLSEEEIDYGRQYEGTTAFATSLSNNSKS